MKLAIANALITILFSAGVFAQGIVGEENLNLWLGDYEVMSCDSCPDSKVSEGYSIRDIKEFYIGTFVVPSSELPECAQTNNDIYFDYTLKSQAGTLWTSFFSEGGLCYWGVDEARSLIMTRNSFEYKLTKNNRKLVTSITMGEQNLYNLYQSVNDGDRVFNFKATLRKK